MASDTIKQNPLTLKPILLRSGIGNIITLAVLTVSTGIMAGIQTSLSLLAGGLLAIINFYWLGLTIKSGISLPADRAKRFVTTRYYIRFGLTVLVISLLITRGFVTPVAIITGFTIILINTFLMTLWIIKREGF